jgi:hypothetical protein
MTWPPPDVIRDAPSWYPEEDAGRSRFDWLELDDRQRAQDAVRSWIDVARARTLGSVHPRQTPYVR